MKSSSFILCAVISILSLTVAQSDEAGKDVNNKAFHKRLLEIAKEYKNSYHCVNPRSNWAPTMCKMPPKVAIHSRSKEKASHGQKLYFLFAAKHKEYRKHVKGKSVASMGQVLVKESWIPKEIKGEPKNYKPPESLSAAKKNGKIYVPHKKKALFVMFKVDEKTAGTDKGWVYGTVTADGKTVTSSGNVKSCMNCHTKIKGRLFGL